MIINKHKKALKTEKEELKSSLHKSFLQFRKTNNEIY